MFGRKDYLATKLVAPNNGDAMVSKHFSQDGMARLSDNEHKSRQRWKNLQPRIKLWQTRYVWIAFLIKSNYVFLNQCSKFGAVTHSCFSGLA